MEIQAFVPHLTFDGPFEARLATPEDVDEMLPVELVSQSAPWPRRVFEREFEVEFSRVWIVDWKEEDAASPIAAYLVFWVVHDEVHVLNVVVHPDARRRGLARRLLEDLIEIARREKASLISLEFRVSNEAARGLYESLGFVPIGSRSEYYADNQEDAEVMALLLSD